MKTMIKRVTTEYYEEIISHTEKYNMSGVVPDTKRIIKVETTVEKWCNTSKGDPLVSKTFEIM
jgi:hypothetical protein|tara:strand:- start:132 stop:320 length:189 start_codon:yes stop_codon:yes gene_type:complete